MNPDAQQLQTIELAIEGGVATVTFNRPEVRNAVNDAMRAELTGVLDQLTNDDAVRAVVLTGKGTGFCSGGDIAGMQKRLAAPPADVAFDGWRRQKRLHQSIALLHGMGKPTVAAVNGAAAGLGCDLALACDFIIASEAAYFTMSFILRGLVPDGGGLYFLPRRVGLARAKELIFTGRRVPAHEALAIGLVDRLASPERLLTEARAWATQLGGGSRVALALAKSILDKTFELGEEQVLALGREAQAICYTTAEHREQVAAFLNKA
jgi:enoyl-CoA hydratase/carnithine racemase